MTISGKLLAFATQDRGSPGNHFEKAEDRRLRLLVLSTFIHSTYMQPMDSRDAGGTNGSLGYNSRFAGIYAGAVATLGGGQESFTETDVYVKGQYHFADSANDNAIFAALDTGGNDLFVLKRTSADKIAVLDSTGVQVELGSHVYAVGDHIDHLDHLDMVAGTAVVKIYNNHTGALVETINASGDFGDEPGGDVFADFYDGQVTSHGSGHTSGNWGSSRYASTGNWIPGFRTHTQRVAELVSGGSAWTSSSGSHVTDVRISTGEISSSPGNFITHASGAGTGAGSRIKFALDSLATSPVAGRIPCGVIAIMDGHSDTAGSSARYLLIYTYKGVDYPLAATAQMNPYVNGDGGWPHTRKLKFLDQDAATGVWLGPDGLPWDIAALSAATISVQMSADTDGAHIDGVCVMIAFTDQATFAAPLVKDAEIRKAALVNNIGADPTIAIRANAAGSTIQRILFDFGSLSHVPTGWVFDSAPLVLNCTAVTTGGQPIGFYRMTQLGWVEGIGTIAVPQSPSSEEGGVSWTNYDNFNGSELSDPWVTLGGDFSASGASVGINDPTTTGLKTFDIKDVMQTCHQNGGQANFIMKRVTESGTLTGAVFDSGEGSVPPTLQYTVHVADTTDPVAEITSPADASITSLALISIAGTISDNVSDPDACDLELTITGPNGYDETLAPTVTRAGAFSVPTVALPYDGTYTIEATPTDEADNEGTSDSITVVRRKDSVSEVVAPGVADGVDGTGPLFWARFGRRR